MVGILVGRGIIRFIMRDASIRDYYPYNKNSFLIAVAHILEISR